MKPRFSSSVVTAPSFVQQVYRCTEDEWRRLPPQMRGFVLHQMAKGLTPRLALEAIEAGRFGSSYDPQGTFDAFQGLQPA